MGGEDISLMTEIVLRKNNSALFEKPEGAQDKSPITVKPLHTRLDMVSELQSEAGESCVVNNAFGQELFMLGEDVTDSFAESVGAITFGDQDNSQLRREINKEKH